MKTIHYIIIFLVLISFSGTVIAENKKNYTIKLEQVTPGIWMHISYNDFNGKSFPSNGLVIVTEKGPVFIDTAWGNEQTQQLLDITLKKFKKKPVLAIITHFHDDRIGGIDVLLKNGIPVRSTPLTAKLAKEIGFASPQPTLDPEKELITVGNTKIEVLFPGGGHTRDNITVWLPGKKVLFGGCLVKALNWNSPGYLKDADLPNWPHALQKVLDTYPDVKTVIPGHGQWGDIKLLHHTLELVKRHIERSTS